MTRTVAGAQPREDATRIRWGRILAGGFLLELALIIVLVPLLAVVELSRIIPLVVVALFIFGFACGWLVARKLQGRHVFHATAAGVVATIIYIGLCMFNPDGGIRAVVDMYGPVTFVFGNLLRIVGCTAGGFANRARNAAARA